jgi:hypothetical protein
VPPLTAGIRWKWPDAAKTVSALWNKFHATRLCKRSQGATVSTEGIL